MLPHAWQKGVLWVLTFLYLGLCLGASVLAGRRLPSLYQMGLLLLGFCTFLLGFFQYFYPLADLSPDVLERELKQLQAPLPSAKRIWMGVGLGLVCLGGVWWLSQGG